MNGDQKVGKFAVMTFRHVDDQSQAGTGIVGRLINLLKGWRSNVAVQTIGTVIFKGDAHEMGYILQLSDFIVKWDRLSPNRRRKKLLKYLGLLEELGIEMVCIPYYWSVLPEEVIEVMKKRFVVDSGYQMRIFALVESIKYLMGMLKDRVLDMEVGIWGADTRVGRLFARVLAPYVNNMVLGGTSIDDLYELADEVMRETGLACPVTTDAGECLKDKRLVVVAEECDFSLLSSHAIVVYAGEIDLKYIEAMKRHPGPFWILSGWATLPDEVKADIELLPWETLGVLQALSLMGEEIREMNRILDTLKMRGFISPEGGITYNTFRIRHFRKRT
ncbi:hypothetical protein [Caldicoprobacter faecalis]|uniref:Uncharacterized protein n=1 Tax=Caldicoprobacter faecalis TaxID=937334 RepID=A0A1I5YBP7_9FIRM|nr:hypothetical protein [Caldicoprobacter faecalis]SFQ41603.1 hypothetical protein SAMN05444406_14111 [Caldicoprobacter faecalis]